MTNTKRILITTDYSEIFIVRAKGKNVIRGFCPGCNSETQILSLDEAVSLSGNTALEIFKLISEHKVHFLETASGHLLICRNSISGVFFSNREK